MTAQLQRILMVEDDLDIQVVARLSLEAVGGFEMQICSGGREALQLVQEFAPDLVLLDVMMPDMDGPTVFQHLRAREATRELPIVFMTARAQAPEIEAYLAMGALGVVSKPFDPMELPATLTAFWNQQLATQQLATQQLATQQLATQQLATQQQSPDAKPMANGAASPDY